MLVFGAVATAENAFGHEKEFHSPAAAVDQGQQFGAQLSRALLLTSNNSPRRRTRTDAPTLLARFATPRRTTIKDDAGRLSAALSGHCSMTQSELLPQPQQIRTTGPFQFTKQRVIFSVIAVAHVKLPATNCLRKSARSQLRALAKSATTCSLHQMN